MGSDHRNDVSDAGRSRRIGVEVLRTVQRTEALGDWVPRVIFAVLWLGPVAIAIGGGMINVIIVGIVMGIVSPLAIRVTTTVILNPMRSLRYRQASQRLGGHVSLASPTFLHRHDWSGPFPGALGITALPGAHGIATQHCLLLMDASTLYQLQPLPADAVLDVLVEREATHVTRTKHGLRYILGAGSATFGAVSVGGRSHSVTRTIQTAAVELRYRASSTGQIRTAVIDFGEDLRGAENLRVALADLRMHGHPQPAGSASTRSFL